MRFSPSFVHAGMKLFLFAGIVGSNLACESSVPLDQREENAAISVAALAANEKAAFDFFVSKGFSAVQAAGIVGNLMQESGIDPTIQEYDGGPGRGIAQWSVGGRWDTGTNANAVWYANQQGKSVWSFDLQLDFILWELTSKGYGYSKLKAATTIDDATAIFENEYELCPSSLALCALSSRVTYAHEAYDAYAKDAPSAAPTGPTIGDLDNATCTTISGWSQDTRDGAKPISVDLFFDGPVGGPFVGSLRLDANIKRDDLCSVIGSCEHGYATSMPLALIDGANHTVYAYGVGIDGVRTPLMNAPKSLTCTASKLPVNAERRHIQNPTSFTEWKFNIFRGALPVSPADLEALKEGTPLPLAPRALRDPAGTIWVIDGGTKRQVKDTASVRAWSFDMTDATAAEVAGASTGRDWPAKPYVIYERASGGAFILDSIEGTNDDPSSNAPPAKKEESTTDVGDSSAGCRVATSTVSRFDGGAVLLALASLFVVRRSARRVVRSSSEGSS